MKKYSTVLTRKGQTTIPAEIRRVLDLKQGDRMEWVQEGDQVRLVPAGSVTARTAGMFKTDEPPRSAASRSSSAERAIAEEVVARIGA